MITIIYRKFSEELSAIHYEYIQNKSLLEWEDLWQGEIGVLVYLLRHENAKAGELANSLKKSTGRVANILKALEKKEYIERGRTAHDKRKVLIVLTEKGKWFVSQKYEKNLQMHSWLLEQLGLEDAKEYVRLNKKVLNIMKKDKK